MKSKILITLLTIINSLFGYSQLKLVKKNDKFCYKNAENKIVIPCMYDWAYEFENGIARVKKDGKMGFINGANKIVIPFDFDYISRLNENLAFFSYEPRGLKGIIDNYGNIIKKPAFRGVGNFENGIAYVKDKDYKSIIINNNQ